MTNPYQLEIDALKTELGEFFEIAQSMNPSYTKEQWAINVLIPECKILNTKFNAIRYSGGHPDDELRVAIFAHKQLVEEITGQSPIY